MKKLIATSLLLLLASASHAATQNQAVQRFFRLKNTGYLGIVNVQCADTSSLWQGLAIGRFWDCPLPAFGGTVNIGGIAGSDSDILGPYGFSNECTAEGKNTTQMAIYNGATQYDNVKLTDADCGKGGKMIGHVTISTWHYPICRSFQCLNVYGPYAH